MRSVVFALLACALAAPARAQFVPPPPAAEAEAADEEVSLSGPRFGVTHLSDGIVRTLRDNYYITVGSVVTQFGWQFERHLYSNGNITALTEWIVLVGGLEQGTALPSGSWLVGLRARNGFEVGVGPNLTPAGPALAIAAGVTFGMGPLKVPVNVAVVPSRSGTRISLLTGFNTRRGK
jgi:hypothetical protein